jgi:DNA end-binding protein Ku
MKPRCAWSGYLKISLVTVPVRVYTAISTTEKISFHQLHKHCHQRIRQKLVCPVHGEIKRQDLVKGYEYCSDTFVVLNEAELDAVRLETTGTIELVQFIRAEELDPMFLDTPYYVGPDGSVAEEGFAVLREALRRTKRIGIGRVVLGGKERLVALKAWGNGLVFFAMRYLSEVRSAAPYFEGLSGQPVDAAQLALAQKLIENKSGPLELAAFTDRYQTAVLDLIKSKIEGTKPVLVVGDGTPGVLSLMEALRQSVTQRVRPDTRSNGHNKASLLSKRKAMQRALHSVPSAPASNGHCIDEGARKQ